MCTVGTWRVSPAPTRATRHIRGAEEIVGKGFLHVDWGKNLKFSSIKTHSHGATAVAIDTNNKLCETIGKLKRTKSVVLSSYIAPFIFFREESFMQTYINSDTLPVLQQWVWTLPSLQKSRCWYLPVWMILQTETFDVVYVCAGDGEGWFTAGARGTEGAAEPVHPATHAPWIHHRGPATVHHPRTAHRTTPVRRARQGGYSNSFVFVAELFV